MGEIFANESRSELRNVEDGSDAWNIPVESCIGNLEVYPLEGSVR